LIRPGGAEHDCYGAIAAIIRQQFADNPLDRVDREMNGERRPRRGESCELFMFRHRGGASLDAGQNQGLRHFRQSELNSQGGGGGGESRNARRDSVGNGELVQRADLFA
jgi:hypothetical protein